MGSIVTGARGGYRDRAMSPSPLNWKSRVATALREFGAYAAIALVVPGGTLIALSAWVIRHRAKRTSEQTTAEKPQADTHEVDYGAARARAIRWLGDRYLLAKPINRGYGPWQVAPPANVGRRQPLDMK